MTIWKTFTLCVSWLCQCSQCCGFTKLPPHPTPEVNENILSPEENAFCVCPAAWGTFFGPLFLNPLQFMKSSVTTEMISFPVMQLHNLPDFFIFGQHNYGGMVVVKPPNN